MRNIIFILVLVFIFSGYVYDIKDECGLKAGTVEFRSAKTQKEIEKISSGYITTACLKSKPVQVPTEDEKPLEDQIRDLRKELQTLKQITK